MSEYERAKIIERSMRGRKHWLKQGVLMSNGCKTFGYTYHRRTPSAHPYYEINEKEAPIVREIFEMYAKGDVSLREIARHLVKKKAYRRAKSAPWNWNHIYHILRHEMYTGVRYFDTMTDVNEDQDPLQKKKARKMTYRDRRDWIGIPVPQIVSKELFEAVQARLDHNKACYRNAKGKQLLSGLLWCGRCGSHCFSFRQYYWVRRLKRVSMRIYERYLYTCNGRRKKGYCDTGQVDTRPIDTCVFQMIEEGMFDTEKLRPWLKNLNKRVNKLKIDKEVKSIDQKIKDIDVKKNRLIDLYASGDLAKEEYLKRIVQYDTEAQLLEGKKNELLRRVPVAHKPEAIDAALKAYCERAKVRFEQCNDFATKRQFLLDFIARVTYRNDRVTVAGRIPVGAAEIEFEIKRKIDRKEMRNQTLEYHRKIGLNGTSVRREQFRHMINNKAKIITQAI
jgi:site-specific DNA recombinase